MKKKFFFYEDYIIYNDNKIFLKDIIKYYIEENNFRKDTAIHFGLSINQLITILSHYNIVKPLKARNENHSKAYKSLSNEEKENRKQLQKEGWANKSIEEKVQINNKRSQAWASKTEEEMLSYKNNVSTILLNSWANKPEDEKLIHRENIKKAWDTMEEEKKFQIFENRLNSWAQHTEEDRKEIGNKISEKYQNKSDEEKLKIQELKSKAQKEAWERKTPEEIINTVEKIMKSKKENNSFHTSKPEKDLLNLLNIIFNREDIETQYCKDPRYPFPCDFYVKSLNLFIELNIFMTHGFHPFNPDNIEDIKKVQLWKEKSKTHPLYKIALKVWIESDPKKLKIAKENKLNYLMVYSYKELNSILECKTKNSFQNLVIQLQEKYHTLREEY